MATVKYQRSSCGYCQTGGEHRHKNCPGSLPYARAGKPWTCWCSENGHPEPGALPKPPTVTVKDEDEAPAPADAEQPEDQPAAPEMPAASKPAKAAKGEKAPRCGHPTSKGPCKRVEGHTRGHDAR